MRLLTAPLILLAASLTALGACSRDTTTGTEFVSGPRPHITTGCSPTDAPPGGPNEIGRLHSSSNEGEIFGSIYGDGSRACFEHDDDFMMRLVPLGFTISGFDTLIDPKHAFRLMWEYWDVNGGDGPCALSPLPIEGRHPSVHGDSVPEAHCVTGGGRSFTFTGPSRTGTRTFVVDYVGVGSSVSAPGGYSQLASTSPTSFYGDLVINTDLGSSTGYTSTPKLDIDATAAPSSAAFSPTGAPSGDTSSTFRIATYRSTTNWSTTDSDMGGRGTFLARLYYQDGSSTWVPLTGYYDPTVGQEGRILITQKFAGPTSCPAEPRQYTIGMEMLRPDQNPANAPTSGDSSQVTISVACPEGAEEVPPPSDLGSSSVSYTSATVTWTNGTSASTEVEYGPAGSSYAAASGSPVSSGSTSLGLTGLTPQTSYKVRIRHTSGGNSSSWVESSSLFTTSTVAAPSSIGASGVGSTTATISWTNGTTASGTLTTLQISSGGSYTTVSSSIDATTTSSYGLTGLTPSTAYSVKLFHTLAGANSSTTTASSLFTTDDAPVAITSFATTGSCSRWFEGGKWRITNDFGWTETGTVTGMTWQMLESETNDTTAGTVVASGSSGLTATTPEYREIDDALYRYYWVRYSGHTGWYPLYGNPFRVTVCDA